MRIRIVFFSTFFLLLSAATYSQHWAFELWHEGKVVLDKGDTLRGLVKYDLQQDLVQYTLADKKAEVYTARKVLFFEIFDETVHKYRQFFALPYGNPTGYKTPMFFELLEDGQLTLLARESLEYKTYSSPYNIGSASRLVLVYKFFFLKENGEIEEFQGNKNDLISLMGKSGKQVHKYIKTNRLKIDDKEDFAKVVGYYNSLQQSGS
jgi:hypothetical protein